MNTETLIAVKQASRSLLAGGLAAGGAAATFVSNQIEAVAKATNQIVEAPAEQTTSTPKRRKYTTYVAPTPTPQEIVVKRHKVKRRKTKKTKGNPIMLPVYVVTDGSTYDHTTIAAVFTDFDMAFEYVRAAITRGNKAWKCTRGQDGHSAVWTQGFSQFVSIDCLNLNQVGD